MREPRIRINRLQEEVIQAAYEWRSADVNQACGVMGIGRDDPNAAEKYEAALSNLRIKIDNLHREEKSLGLL